MTRTSLALGIGLGLVARKGAGATAPPAYTPALKFNDARNSQYIGQVT